jgi:hypothetical protein
LLQQSGLFQIPWCHFLTPVSSDLSLEHGLRSIEKVKPS